jgi:MFS family permease
MKRASPHLIAFLTVTIDLLGFGIVLPLLPLYGDRFLGDAEWLAAQVQSLGFDAKAAASVAQGAIIGLLMSVFSLMQFLFAPFWGRLSDRIGRRPVLMVSLASSGIFYLLFGYATLVGNLALLFVSRIGAGVAGATIGTAQAVIADSTPRERRARGMALIGMAFGIGFTLGPVIGAMFANPDPHGPMSPMPGFIAAGLSFSAFIVATVVLPETRPLGGEARQRRLFDLEGWRLALGHRSTAIPLLTFFISTLAFASFEGTIARFGRDQLHYTVAELGYLFAYFGLVLVLTQGIIVRPLVSHVGETPMAITGLVLMVGGLVAVALIGSPDSPPLVLGTTAAAVAGFGCLNPSTQALISRRSSALRQGEILGVNQAAASIARILGPLMGNVLYGGTVDPHPSWPLYAGVVLLGIALVIAVALLGKSGEGANLNDER